MRKMMIGAVAVVLAACGTAGALAPSAHAESDAAIHEGAGQNAGREVVETTTTTEAPTTTMPTTTTTQAPTTSVAPTTTTTAAPAAPTLNDILGNEAVAIYHDWVKNHEYYEGETDAEIAEEAEFGCSLFGEHTVTEFVTLTAAETGYEWSVDEIWGLKLMAAAYCPEAS